MRNFDLSIHPLNPHIGVPHQTAEDSNNRGELTAQHTFRGAGQRVRAQLREARDRAYHGLQQDSRRYSELNEDQCYRFLRDLATAPRVQDSQFAEMMAKSQGFRSMAHVVDTLRIDAGSFASHEMMGTLVRQPNKHRMHGVNHWVRDRGREILTGGLAMGAFALAAPPVAAALGLAVAAPAIGTAVASVVGGSFGSWMGEVYKNKKLYKKDQKGESVATRAAAVIIARLLAAKQTAQIALKEIDSMEVSGAVPREALSERAAKLAQGIVNTNCQMMFDEVNTFWKQDKGGRVWQAIGGAAGSFAGGMYGAQAYNAIANMIQAKALPAGYALANGETFRVIDGVWHAVSPANGTSFGVDQFASAKIFGAEFGNQIAQNNTLVSAAGSTVLLGMRDAATGVWGSAMRARRMSAGRREMVTMAGSFGDYIPLSTPGHGHDSHGHAPAEVAHGNAGHGGTDHTPDPKPTNHTTPAKHPDEPIEISAPEDPDPARTGPRGIVADD